MKIKKVDTKSFISIIIVSIVLLLCCVLLADVFKKEVLPIENQTQKLPSFIDVSIDDELVTNNEYSFDVNEEYLISVPDLLSTNLAIETNDTVAKNVIVETSFGNNYFSSKNLNKYFEIKQTVNGWIFKASKSFEQIIRESVGVCFKSVTNVDDTLYYYKLVFTNVENLSTEIIFKVNKLPTSLKLNQTNIVF